MPQELLSNDSLAPGNTEAKTPDDAFEFFNRNDKSLPDTEKDTKLDPDKDDEDDKDEDERPHRRKRDDKKKDDKKDEINLGEDFESDEEETEEDDDELGLKKDKEKEKEKDTEDEFRPPPRVKDIQAKYPKIFEDFPYLKKVLFRDRGYTELFGSFDDAKEAAGRAQAFATFESDLLSGKTENILSEVKRVDSKAFDKLVDNYLPTLYKVDKEAYFEVTQNIGKVMIAQLAKEGKLVGESNKELGEQIHEAALFLNQMLFRSNEFTPPKPRVTEKTEDETVDKERQEWQNERFQIVNNDLRTKVDNSLRSAIDENIDPKGEMSPYVKRNAIRDALDEIHKTLGEDRAFRSRYDNLWKEAFSNKLSASSVEKLRKYYMGSCRPIIAGIIRKTRAEALRNETPRSRKSADDNEEETSSSRRNPITTGRPRQSGGNSRKQLQPGESYEDFFSREK